MIICNDQFISLSHKIDMIKNYLVISLSIQILSILLAVLILF